MHVLTAASVVEKLMTVMLINITVFKNQLERGISMLNRNLPGEACVVTGLVNQGLWVQSRH